MFYKENLKWDNQTLIYKTTLGESLSFNGDLAKVTQLEWLGAFTKLSPSSLEELGIDCINNHSGSWMKIMSKYLLNSKIISVRSLFFLNVLQKELDIVDNYAWTSLIIEWIDCFLISQISWYFLEYYSLLK